MKINIKAFAMTFTIIMSILILVISIWSRLSTSFGMEFMDLFNSVHPHPFRASIGNLGIAEEFFGVGFDIFYAIIDSIIFSLGFGLLYNWFVQKSVDKTRTDTEENE